MKKGIALLLALCLLLTLAACGGTTGSDDPAGSAPTETGVETSDPATITVVDHADHTVTLPADVQRIAVCDRPAAVGPPDHLLRFCRRDRRHGAAQHERGEEQPAL